MNSKPTHHQTRWILRLAFRGNVVCRAPGPRAGRTAHQWIAGGRRRRKQSRPGDRPARAPCAPSQTTRCRGSTWSTWRRNSCANTHVTLTDKHTEHWQTIRHVTKEDKDARWQHDTSERMSPTMDTTVVHL